MIIRAKKNCVAYFEAEVPEKKLRGRPRKYGEKVKVSELFDFQDWFEKLVSHNFSFSIPRYSVLNFNLILYVVLIQRSYD